MDKSVPTRYNLHKLKDSIESIAAGVEILKARRQALTKEFFSLVEECMGKRADLSGLILKAQKKLELVRALKGEQALSLAQATSRKVSLDIKVTSIWGVNVPEIVERAVVRNLGARGVSPLGESAGVIASAKDFEKVVDKIIKMAPREARLNRLGEMIKMDTRKINAIDEFIIPSIKRRIKMIERVLEQREREEIFRLKRYKSRKAAS